MTSAAETPKNPWPLPKQPSDDQVFDAIDKHLSSYDWAAINASSADKPKRRRP